MTNLLCDYFANTEPVALRAGTDIGAEYGTKLRSIDRY